MNAPVVNGDQAARSGYSDTWRAESTQNRFQKGIDMSHVHNAVCIAFLQTF